MKSCFFHDSRRPPTVATIHRKRGRHSSRAVSDGREDLVNRIFSVAPEMIEQKAAAGDRVTALDIAFEKCHENVLIRLLELRPSLIDVVANSDNNFVWVDGTTVLHRAAGKGLDAVVAHLLAAKPQLLGAVTKDGSTALDFAAFEGHLTVITHLLAVSPALIEISNENDRTALHCAASKGHLPVVAHLLAAKPELIDAIDTSLSWTALHYVASTDAIPVAAHLLAAKPELISVVGDSGWTALHVAAMSGQIEMGEYLLSVSPALTDGVDKQGWTALHAAAFGDTLPSSLVRTMLAIKPDLISAKDHQGRTVLHRVVQFRKPKEVIEEMWRLYPEALRVGNANNDTPFHIAVDKENFTAIDVLQWHLTWEEIEDVYDSCRTSYEERFRPVMETQCESLSLWLLPDVVGTVFEYLGFERAKQSFVASQRTLR